MGPERKPLGVPAWGLTRIAQARSGAPNFGAGGLPFGRPAGVELASEGSSWVLATRIRPVGVYSRLPNCQVGAPSDCIKFIIITSSHK